MADLELWKKYPAEGEEGEDSYRLDHPSFQNVQRVTYAKGVITDFKTIEEDPIEVDSLVKVEIEGYGESDYIPLFYHPKPQYWDNEDEGVLATDFDTEQKCHKRAWMSFRIGDEVVVLMEASHEGSSLEPKYVIGFYDNYPRPGEDILKTTGDVEEWLRLNLYPAEIYDEQDKGLDGLALQLLTECEKRTVEEDATEITDSYQAYGTIYWYENLEIIGGPGWGNVCWDEYRALWYDNYKVYSYDLRNYYIYLVPVGPKLYLVRILGRETWRIDREHVWNQSEKSYYGHYCTAPCIVYNGDCETVRQVLEDGAALSQEEPDPMPDGSYPLWYNQTKKYTTSISVASALYNDENLEIARTANPTIEGWPPPWPPEPFTSIYVELDYHKRFNELEKRIIAIEAYVRPHTKEELIEAGLFNVDGSLP